MTRSRLGPLSIAHLGWLCLLHGCSSTAPPPEVIAAPMPSDAELVRAALPAVVLVVNTRDDNKTTYGAGFFSSERRVLTADHVVEAKGRVSVMLFRQDRSTYSPMDGGIMRFLFENVRDLVPARIVKRDSVSDLAVLEVDGPVARHPTLPWSNDAGRPGDRVYALGHPQQTPWSFSAGVIGALQYGLIQHDATVGPGSSGGPLLNVRGEVVGVNVAQVVSEPVGLSFARPGSVVASAVGDVGAPRSIIDLTSATATALSCWRAQELALKEVGECFDWDTEWKQYLALLEEASKHVQEDVRARILDCGRGQEAKERWIARRKEKVSRALDPTLMKKKDPDIDPADPDLPPEIAQLLRDGIADWKRVAEAKNELDSDYYDVGRLRTRLRQGLRVEDTRRVAPDKEWVLLASRNSDGTLAHLAELYVQVGEQWVQRASPWGEEVALMPLGWPEPMETFARRRSFGLAYLIKRAVRGDNSCGPTPHRSEQG